MKKYWIVKKIYFCTKTHGTCLYGSEFLDYNEQPDIDCSKCKIKNPDGVV